MSPGPRTERGRWSGAVIVVCLAAVTVGVRWMASRLPRPRSAEAADDQFSAARAFDHLERIAAEPRPTGSPGHDAARAYLLATLRELGLETGVQEREGAMERWTASRHLVNASRVRNVVARLPGRASSGAILLVSHYDTVPGSPGAADSGAGVASLLEVLRAVRAGDTLANDLILLLTDAEEIGLLGARVFIERPPWMSDVELVLNFDARGTRGPVWRFETGPGNLWQVLAFRRAVPHPVGS